MPFFRRPLALAAVGAALFFLLTHGVLLWKAHHHYALGRSRQAAGATIEAAREYQSAIGFYAPLNPWSRAAAGALASLTKDAEGKDSALAFELEDRLRRSIQGTRWLVQPYADILAKLDRPPGPALRDPSPWLFFLSIAGLAAAFWGIGAVRKGMVFRVVVAGCGLAVWGLALRFC